MGKHAKGHLAGVAYSLLRVIQETAEETGITLFGDYGTLLGAARDGKFIPWDSDLDVSVLRDSDDFPEKFDRFLTRLKRQGVNWREKVSDRRLGLKRESSGVAVSRNGMSCDIFVWQCFDPNISNPLPQSIHPQTNKSIPPRTPQEAFYALHQTNLTLDSNRSLEGVLRGDDGLPRPFWGRLRYANTDWNHGKGVFILPHWVEEFVQLPFGSIKLKAPKEWEALLTHRYGDWKQPVCQKDSSNARREFLKHAKGMKHSEAAQAALKK